MADLTATNLGSANLIEADLAHADLYGANLLKAQFYEARLSGATLMYAQLVENPVTKRQSLRLSTFGIFCGSQS
ncbi:MAG: pentapeptide repeat-containing protein [Anaerolineae bacterium]